MNCTNCGKELAEGIKFCPECGTPVPKNKFCTSCGTKLEPGAKFCPECGTKVGGAAASVSVTADVEEKIGNAAEYDRTESIDELISAGTKYICLNEVRDYSKALSIFNEVLARDVNNGNANYWLGYLYDKGYGVEKDSERAFELYMKAAETGDGSALLAVGESYYLGKGVKKNEEKAFEFYRKSAETGNEYAAYYTGDCYQYGWGTEENVNEAIKWYKAAADQEYSDAYHELGNCYALLEKYKEAFEWYKKGADEENEESIKELGFCYLHGDGTKRNYDKTFECFDRLGEDYEGMPYWLGMAYLNGEGVGKDHDEAVRLFKLGMERDDDDLCREQLKELGEL